MMFISRQAARLLQEQNLCRIGNGIIMRETWGEERDDNPEVWGQAVLASYNRFSESGLQVLFLLLLGIYWLQSFVRGLSRVAGALDVSRAEALSYLREDQGWGSPWVLIMVAFLL